MLSWEDFVVIRNLYERGWSVTKIADHLGRDRKTIRRYLNDPDLVPGQRRRVPTVVDPLAAYIDARLKDNVHIAATVLLRELQEFGFTGSYRTLARYLQDNRPQCKVCRGPEPTESVMMERRAGSAQADWSPFYWTPAGRHQEVEVQLFAIELCRPQAVYAEFFERQSWAHLAAGHMSAFDYFGGTPTEIRYDRSSQVFRPKSDDLSAPFGDFASYYGFKPVPCVPGRSRSNGQIERVFSYVATSFFSTADAATLGELNGHLRRWLDGVANARTSQAVPVAPLQALEAERAHLIPVRRPPYPVELVVHRKVDRYCLVRLDGARYSVEPGHVGQVVEVVTRPGSDDVEIRRGGRVIGAHGRTARGQISFDPEHGAAIQALTLASLGKAGRHKRKRNDARIGPQAAEEAAILRAKQSLGSDGEVATRDLSVYDELWREQ